MGQKPKGEEKSKGEEKTKGDENSKGDEKPKGEEKLKAAAKGFSKGLSGLGNLAELQKQLEDERTKLRMFVIKAKQEWEERRSEASGVTNEQEYYIAPEGEPFGPNREFRCEGSIGRGVFSSVYQCKSIEEGDKSYAVKFVRSNHMMQKAAQK